MNIDERNARGKSYSNFRGSLHIGMGGLYLVMGSAVIYFKAFGVMVLPSIVAYAIGISMLLYGAFRIWRGWMDLKQNKSK